MSRQYFLSNSIEHIDRTRVHRWLSEQSYWAEGRSRDAQDVAMEASLNYGVYATNGGEQVAYARVLTDRVSFAWLCDVFVAPESRGQGIGKILVRGVATDLDSFNSKKVMLATGDAHRLYEQFGFGPLEKPEDFMIRAATGNP